MLHDLQAFQSSQVQLLDLPSQDNAPMVVSQAELDTTRTHRFVQHLPSFPLFLFHHKGADQPRIGEVHVHRHWWSSRHVRRKEEDEHGLKIEFPRNASAVRS